MRPKVGWNSFQLFNGTDRFQYSYLGFEIQSVSAFGLDRRRAELEKPVWKLNAKRRCVSYGFHGRQNPAAASKNIHVRSALNPPFEFIGARAGKDGVRVRVYKTRQNHFAARVEFRRMLVGKPVGWSGPLNHTVTNSNGAVADDAEFRQFGPAPRTPRASNGDELRRMEDV